MEKLNQKDGPMNPQSNEDNLLEQVLRAQKLASDPKI